ncbi:hypothetical protein [Limosilactobacillus fermentum]|nr:hypothetical protein [Limosilactobacillus fermentum]
MEKEYCKAGMTCKKGCPCASTDGICHCDMMDEKRCYCNSHCQSQRD